MMGKVSVLADHDLDRSGAERSGMRLALAGCKGMYSSAGGGGGSCMRYYSRLRKFW